MKSFTEDLELKVKPNVEGVEAKLDSARLSERVLLIRILRELKLMNLHLQAMTDEEFDYGDIDRR